MKLLLIIAFFMATAGTSMAQTGAAQGSQRISKQELKSLLTSAKTSEDHRKLAEHYRAEADRLLAKAEQQQRQAELTKKRPSPLAAKNPAAFGERRQRELAEHYRRKAAEMQALAATHENMARQ